MQHATLSPRRTILLVGLFLLALLIIGATLLLMHAGQPHSTAYMLGAVHNHAVVHLYGAVHGH
jgi:hypothetical protein